MRLDRGSVLVLMPAVLLVVLVLGAISVDLSARFLAQREAVAAAEAAANDAAGAGLDIDGLRRGEGYVLDPAAVRRAVLRSLAAQGVLDQLVRPPSVRVRNAGVEVTLRVSIQGIFTPVIPGAASASEISVTASARLQLR